MLLECHSWVVNSQGLDGFCIASFLSVNSHKMKYLAMSSPMHSQAYTDDHGFGSKVHPFRACGGNLLGVFDKSKNPSSHRCDIRDLFLVLHHTAGIILYRDYLYGNLYQMPILYVEIDI